MGNFTVFSKSRNLCRMYYPMKNVEVFSVKVGTLLGKGVQGEARDLGYTFVFFLGRFSFNVSLRFVVYT